MNPADPPALAPRDEADFAATLPLQPKPVSVIISYIPEHAPERTAIVREFGRKISFCTLCPREKCHQTARGTCLVIAPEVVPAASATFYRLPR